MAITRTVFNSASYSGLASWMQTNLVPGYFAAVTYDSGTNTVTCKNGDGDTVLTIAGSNSTLNVTFYIDGSANVARGYQYNDTIAAAYACTNGALLHFSYTYGGMYGTDILITKTNNEKPAAVFPCDAAMSVGTAAALNSGIRACAVGDETVGSDFSFTAQSQNQTQLVPFATAAQYDAQSYTPNAFYCPVSQHYSAGIGKIVSDGVTFLTNGYWAIKDA